MATIDELTIADAPETWEALGFTVDGGLCQVAGVLLRLVGATSGSGLVSWSLRDVIGERLDGLPTSSSERAVPPSAPAHPNGVVGIDHVVAVSPSLDRSIAVLQAAGLDLRRVREQPTPAGAPRQAFFRLGSELLEVVQEPDEVLERHGGPNRAAHFWGLAMVSEDLDRTVQALAPHASPARAAVQPGRRISTLRRSGGLSLPLALMSMQARIASAA